MPRRRNTANDNTVNRPGGPQASPAPANAPAARPSTRPPIASVEVVPGVRVEVVPLVALQQDDANANAHTRQGMELLESSLRRHGAGRGVLLDRDRRLIAGNATHEQAAAAGIQHVVIVRTEGDQLVATQRDDLTLDEAPARELAIADNWVGQQNLNLQAEELMRQAAELGVDLAGEGITEEDLAAMRAAAAANAEEQREDTGVAGSLTENFGAPPFTVLDARQGYWLLRKREWEALGVHGELGRENLGSTVASGWVDVGAGTGGSVFDPVLCELVYRWFNVPGGSILDPFAGEATKGCVAAWLGHPYTGVELRQGQVDTNRRVWAAMAAGHVDEARPVWAGHPDPQWLCGDSARLAELVPGGPYDLIFTSPPYWDLERYEGGEQDGSGFATYAQFMEWYEGIFAAAVARLRANRFCVVKVGEVRGKDGAYVNFVPDNMYLFQRLGLAYFNEAVLITPVGSLPVRAGRQFRAGRKLAKGHQNILVFYKGDPEHVGRHFAQEVQGVDLSGEEDPGTGDSVMAARGGAAG